jgi:hypothetical protein
MPVGKEAVVVEKTEYNWLPILLIGGAIFLFSQQKGCNGIDLGGIFPGKSEKSSNTVNAQEPSSEYKTSKLDSFRSEISKNKQKAALTAAFYFAYADILTRNPEKFTDKQVFRTQHSKALDLAFKNDPVLREPELGTEIEVYLQEFISLDPGPLDIEKTKKCLLALSWAAYQES